MRHGPVDRPIFLIGTGRCGSSLLYRLLSYHPSLAWQSHYTSRLPGGGAWAALSRLHDAPGLAPLLPQAEGRRYVPQATESYNLLRHATSGLFTSPRELRADELTPAARDALHALVATHTGAQGKPRFVLKHTGFPRVDYLRAAFPDARFVHVMRDGRAVATSLCKVDWWSGEGHWGWGPLSAADRALYAESGFHEIVLAGLYWKVLMAMYAEMRATTPAAQLLEVRYDALVARPAEVLRQILDFCELPSNARFDARVAATSFLSDDTRWRRALQADEIGLLERALDGSLQAHGFHDGASA